MLLIYTGNGKGKTSACVGQAVRALGRGFRVAFGQFMKRPDQAGEQKILAQLLGAAFFACGAGFYRDPADYQRHRSRVEELLGWVRTRLADGLDLLVLDEAVYALGAGLLTAEEMMEMIQLCAARNCHLVLSGRGAPGWLVDRADIVSEIVEVKHVFAQGGKARPGIEF
ncbi:MAG: cob(I)yrinic acid a,c-diamide adenosyltransferase [Deltaproteobacteria bacterium]|nr:cob(I)yrinic acid a,c-diamide adenosyltransferase [Deltaproteobacteria bacterium]